MINVCKIIEFETEKVFICDTSKLPYLTNKTLHINHAVNLLEDGFGNLYTNHSIKDLPIIEIISIK